MLLLLTVVPAFMDWLTPSSPEPAPTSAGGGVDMARLQLLSDLHARGQLSDTQYAQAVALEYQLASLR